MYLRNVKQILRAAGIDERRYGFGGLMDLLRACQRDGLIRTERDRRGGLRVFQGQALASTTVSSVPGIPSPPPDFDMSDEPSETDTMLIQAVEMSDEPPQLEAAADDIDALEAPPSTIVDTTAELLGRSKAKRTRTRAAAAPAAPKRVVKKAVPRRTSRSKKSAESE